MKQTLLILVSAATLVAFGCKKSAGNKAPPATAASTADAGAAVAPVGVDAGAAAVAPPPASGIESGPVFGSPPLPYGQLARVGGVKLAHPLEVVTQVALTADGLISASASYVRAWDRNGNLRWQSWSPGRQSRFALSPDGARVAIARTDATGGRVTVHDRGGTPGPSFATGAIEHVAWSADGGKLVVTGATVEVHDAGTGALIATLAARPALAAAIAADGSVVFVAADGVYRWTFDGAAGAPEPASIAALATPPTAVAVAPDASTVWWSDGKGVTAVDLKTKASTALAIGGAGPIVALSVDGKAVAVAWKGGIRIWDNNATPSQRWQREVKLGAVPVVGFALDGKTVAVADVGTIVIADAATGGWAPSPASPSWRGFNPASFAIIATATATSVFDLANGVESAGGDDRPADAPGWADRIAVDAKGTFIGWSAAAAGACGPLKVWTQGGGEHTLPTPARCPEAGTGAWAVGPSLVASSAGAIFAPEQPEAIVTLPASTRPLIAIATSSDRSHAIAVYGPTTTAGAGADAGTLIDVYELAGATRVHQTRAERSGDTGVTAAAITNDGTAYLGCRDGALLAIARGADAGAPTARFDSFITSIELAPSGKAVAVTDADNRTVVFGAK